MTLRRAARLAVLPAIAACLTGVATSASAASSAPHRSTATVAAAPAAAAPAAARTSTGRTRTVVGASIDAPALGSLPIQRVFRNAIGKAPDRKDVLSFRVWDDAAVHAFVRSAPTGTVLVWKHEPEDDIAQHQFTAQSWADTVVRLTEVIKQEGRVGEVLPATVLMRWTLSPHSHREALLGTLLSPAVLDALRQTQGILAWDAYSGPGSRLTPQNMYGVPADFAASKGLPWAVTETGASKADPVRWTQTFDYLDGMANPPRYFLAWNPARLNDGVFAIQNQPAVAAVWRAAIATHRG